MKHLFFSLLFLVSTSFVLAQSPVPAVIEETFKRDYEDVLQPFWEMREGAYVAMFSDEDGLKKVFYDTDGNWRETRTRIEQAELPPAVRSFIVANYREADKTYIGKVERPDGMFFRVESELADAVVIKLLNAQGELREEQRIALDHLPSSVIIAYPLQNETKTAPVTKE